MVEVSIIVPSFRRPDFLNQTIKSVINQTFQDWELWVVDDNGRGTPDQLETEDVVRGFQAKGESRIKYLVLEKNVGGSAARNAGWRSSRGRFICFLDNDDEFYPQKLERQVQILKNEERRATVCRFESYKQQKLINVSPIIPNRKSYLIPFAQGRFNFASGSTLMLTRELLVELEGFDEAFGRKQDVEFLLRLLTKSTLFVDEAILVKLHIDDRGNIPNLEKFKQFQQLFIHKFTPLFQSFPKKEQKKIASYNQVELAKVCLWNKNWKEFLRVFSSNQIPVGDKLDLLVDLSRKFRTYYLK